MADVECLEHVLVLCGPEPHVLSAAIMPGDIQLREEAEHPRPQQVRQEGKLVAAHIKPAAELQPGAAVCACGTGADLAPDPRCKVDGLHLAARVLGLKQIGPRLSRSAGHAPLGGRWTRSVLNPSGDWLVHAYVGPRRVPLEKAVHLGRVAGVGFEGVHFVLRKVVRVLPSEGLDRVPVARPDVKEDLTRAARGCLLCRRVVRSRRGKVHSRNRNRQRPHPTPRRADLAASRGQRIAQAPLDLG
eukprot:scaffold14582_cov108-Isochrysis_galbana.AAC.6